MMDLVNISVIIPIHNTPAKELRQCLDSVLNQKQVSFEMILVDDFSQKKETIETLTEYEGNYAEKLTCIWLKENRGAAKARNTGLDHAKGRYCIFLDSDDFYDELFLYKLYKKCMECNADICVCGFSFYFEDGRIEENNLNFNLNELFNKDDMLLRIPASCCNRLCKVEYLKRNQIDFQTLPSDNDLFYAVMSTLCTRKIEMISDANLMFYRYGTSYQISSKMNPLNMLSAIKKVYQHSLDKSVYPNRNNMIIVYAIETGLLEMSKCTDKAACAKFYNEFRSFIKSVPHELNESKYRLYEKKWIEYDYSSGWFDLIGDYYAQMKDDDRLWDIVGSADMDIYMWGRGKRGVDFERICLEKKIKIAGVCDRNNADIGKSDAFGNDIVDTKNVEKIQCVLIASNQSVYQDLVSHISKRATLINLEEYCPL